LEETIAKMFITVNDESSSKGGAPKSGILELLRYTLLYILKTKLIFPYENQMLKLCKNHANLHYFCKATCAFFGAIVAII